MFFPRGKTSLLQEEILSFRVQIFVSPAKQKRDICIAFPAAALSSAAAAVAVQTFLCLGHFIGNYKG